VPDVIVGASLGLPHRVQPWRVDYIGDPGTRFRIGREFEPTLPAAPGPATAPNYAAHKHPKVKAWLAGNPQDPYPLHPSLGIVAEPG
jgi:hypothetical protein